MTPEPLIGRLPSKCRHVHRYARKWFDMGDFFQSDTGVKVDKADIAVCLSHPIRVDVYAEFSDDGKRVRLHKILCPSPEGMFTDHVNGDKLDNRRCNLRSASISQSNVNRPYLRPKTSKYRGVSEYYCTSRHGKRYRYWRATICRDYKWITLGTRKSEEECAALYNEAALRLHGEFAKLNTIP